MTILRIPAVATEMGYRSHTSVYTAIHAGLLTHPVRISRRSVGHPSAEIQAINLARIAGQSDEQIRQLVIKLHAARCASTGEQFKPTWLDRSAEHKQQAARRKARSKVLELATV